MRWGWRSQVQESKCISNLLITKWSFINFELFKSTKLTKHMMWQQNVNINQVGHNLKICGHVQAHLHQKLNHIFCNDPLGRIEHGNPSCFHISQKFKPFSFHDYLVWWAPNASLGSCRCINRELEISLLINARMEKQTSFALQVCCGEIHNAYPSWKEPMTHKLGLWHQISNLEKCSHHLQQKQSSLLLQKINP